jgi:hypothetical protein
MRLALLLAAAVILIRDPTGKWGERRRRPRGPILRRNRSSGWLPNADERQNDRCHWRRYTQVAQAGLDALK